MSPPPGQPNQAASLRGRLYNLAKGSGEDFQTVINRFAIERFLYRLGSSEHHRTLILKGASLFLAWEGHPHRRTRDLDLLGHGDPSVPAVVDLIQKICSIPAPDDSLIFDPSSIQGTPIRKAGDYHGVRVCLRAYLAGARAIVQIDVGFGDIVLPAPQEITFPSLLGLPAAKLRAYPPETVVAEKAHAIVHHDMANSRFKDFYDLWECSRLFAFDGATLWKAIHGTFERRKTPIPAGIPTGLKPEFGEADAKRIGWEAFLRKSGISSELSLLQTQAHLRTFLCPLFESQSPLDGHKWDTTTGWSRLNNDQS